MNEQNCKYLYKHLSETEMRKLSRWTDKTKEEFNSINIPWKEILTPSDDLDPRRKKAIDEARIASARRYAKESRLGKSNRRYGGKKREINQVSRKVLQEQERKKHRKDS